MTTANAERAPRSGWREPPRVSGGLPGEGHLREFAAHPTACLMRARAEHGEVAELDLAGQPTVLMTGPEANEAVCRAPDDQLSQSQAYRLMVPIFGSGVIFDAPDHIKDQQLAIQTSALRSRNMHNFAGVISQEVERFVATWGEEGEIDAVAAMTELTLYTSTHCLLGSEFRETMTGEFARLYRDLEAGVQAQAYVREDADLPEFRRRDAARMRLQEMVGEIVRQRRRAAGDYRDVLGSFMTARYEDGRELSLHELTGLIVATMFAGHHTSAGTAARVLIELLRYPRYLPAILEELHAVVGPHGEMTHGALRELPKLEGFIREVLRLHPPLIFLVRRVVRDFHFRDFRIAAGKNVALSPYVSHRIPEVYPDPERFDPERPEHPHLFANIAFGGGRHRCAGNAFAILQLKAIFGTLLRRFRFELAAPPETYEDDPQAMTLRPRSPARIRYRRLPR